MREELKKLEKEAFEDLKKVKDAPSLEEFRIKYLGKKGLISSIMKSIGRLPPEQRPEIGKMVNQLRERITK